MSEKKNTKKMIRIPDKIYNPALIKYINKCVQFQFHGMQCRFLLSHALFSSFDIDDGTVLLMKTIAQRIGFEGINDVKDIGSGTGVIGISLKKKYPDINMTFTDRDALALDFTEENCRQNMIKGYTLAGELGISETERKFDLIVSNIPAKIGDNAFIDLVKRSSSSLNENGKCAFVIIASFAGIVRDAIIKNGCIITYEESTSRHTVFHFKSGKYGVQSVSGFDAYRRGSHEFEEAGHAYKMNSVFNLPDFDIIGYRSLLALRMSKKLDVKGTVAFWNPIHGHLPVNIALLFRDKIGGMIIAGRDLLQLTITRENLLLNGYDDNKLKICHTSFMTGIEDPSEFIFVFPDAVPFSEWENDVLQHLDSLMPPGGLAVISAEIPEIKKILDANKSFYVEDREKLKSYSCIVLRKNNRG